MSAVNSIEVQSWHLLAVLLALFVGVLKTDIVNMIRSLIIIKEQRGLEGKDVLLQSSITGDWNPITVVSYRAPIPFVRGGGVIIKHHDQNGKKYPEKVSFSNWKTFRIRILSE